MEINDQILKSRNSILQNINSNILGEKLEKSSIPQNLVIDFKREFNKLVSRLFNLQTLLEHCHRSTKSEPHHEALGEAYEALASIRDSVIEFTIGDTEINYGTVEVDSLPEYEIEMSFLSADLLRELALEIQSFSKKYNIISVENLAQDLHGVGALLKYKLNLLNSDEKE